MQKITWRRLIAIIIVAFCLGLFASTIISKTNKELAKEQEKKQSFLIDNNLAEKTATLKNNAQYTGNDFTPDERVNIEVYGNRNKSVVNITTEILAYNWFFEPVPREGGIGSGSIIDAKKGYILTNNHVIAEANKLYVTLWDGTKVEGDIVGIDSENDLAIIKIDPKDFVLEEIPVGDSSKLQIGQKVLAIGNPFGLDRTLTTGIISGLGRTIKSSRNIVIQNMIQTDASINPGNSGGPLLNSKGEIIGINTMIVSPSQGSVGVGFAVPSSTAKRVIPDLIKYGKVRRGWIEWTIQPLFPELVKYAKLPVSQGLLITAVEKRGNADDAGIKGGTRTKAVQYGRTIILLGGDIVVKINDKEVTTISDYLEALESTKPKDVVTVEYYRDKKLKTTEIKLVERPENLLID